MTAINRLTTFVLAGRTHHQRVLKVTVSVSGMVLISVLLLTGCSAATSNASSMGGSSPTSTSDVPDAKSGNSNDYGVAPIDGVVISGNPAPLGDSFKVTDRHGSYTVNTLKIPPLDSVKATAVSPETKKSALAFFVDFVGTQGMDSIVLDDSSRWEEWKKTVAPKYIAADKLDEILNANPDSTGADVIFNNKQVGNPVIAVGLRDGGARVVNKTLTGLTMKGGNDGSIYVSGVATEIIFFDDASAKAWNQIRWGNNSNDANPVFSDEVFQAVKLRMGFSYTLVPDGDSWKIAGFSNMYTVDAGLSPDMNAPSDILALRK